MTQRRGSNPDFLNGVPELLVLRLLARQPMHGYEVVRAIKAASNAELEFGEGSIYPILHRLEKSGALVAERELVETRSRIVYRVTPEGRKRLESATQAWQGVVRAVSAVLQGGSDAPTELA